MTHRHKAVKTEDFGFTGPVSPNENRAAHGNICRVETCACGANRKTNINQQHEECGEWKMPSGTSLPVYDRYF